MIGDLSLENVAIRLMAMEPDRPSVGRLAQELITYSWGLRLPSSSRRERAVARRSRNIITRRADDGPHHPRKETDR